MMIEQVASVIEELISRDCASVWKEFRLSFRTRGDQEYGDESLKKIYIFPFKRF